MNNTPIVSSEQLYWHLEGTGHIEQPSSPAPPEEDSTTLLSALDQDSSNMFPCSANTNTSPLKSTQPTYFILLAEPLSPDVTKSFRKTIPVICDL